MILIIGAIIVVGSVLGGFSMAGGHMHALLHPSEVVTIGGAALGAMVMAATPRMIMDMCRGVLSCIKGSPYNRKMYVETFKCMYELMRITRRDGVLALEPHVLTPKESSVLSKYSRLSKNKRLLSFICDGLAPVIEGTVDEPEKLQALLEAEIHVMEAEHHDAVGLLQKTADALPGFGIVAAVLGIVITMGAISGPVEEVGHKVGAALVGTFLGILLSYGFVGPFAARLEVIGHAEMAYYKTVAELVASFASPSSPKVVIDQARRGVCTDYRPDRAQLEKLLDEAESPAASAA